MISFLRKISLRARLFLLMAFALLALLIAVVSAFRMAQMSATFAERQTEISVNSASHELARDSQEIGKPQNKFDRRGNLFPHIREINNIYNDEFSRTAALTLRRYENVAGGFCDVNGNPQGFISANSISNENQIAQNICRESVAITDSTTKKIETNGDFIYAVNTPVLVDKNFQSTEIISAFAFKNLPQPNNFSDKFSLLTQIFLLISVVGLVIFSFLTLREWRRGILKIETGLNSISHDLNSRIDVPKIAELEHISNEINSLAGNLQSNLKRRQELETDLVRNEKLAALGRVASGIAHEVRNPLASMKLKIQLSERNKFEPHKLEKTFGVLIEEIERIDGLVKKLLDISRPSKLNFEKISLVKLIERRISFISEKAESQNVQIETDFFDEDLIINADPEKIAQVLDNLFLNAIEAMPNGGKLNVKINDLPNLLQVKIANDGEQITDNEKEKIFEPFFTTKDSGTGLGLSISREIMEAHGGKIYLADTSRTEFIIEIPKN